jgi:hypothetical protein
MVKLFFILLSLVFISPSYGATIYQWIDQKGIDNFTDDYGIVPSEYRNQVQPMVVEDIPEKVKTGPQKEETQKDILGLGEEWWRGKVRPWDKQLEEASENYKLTNEELLGESKKLILRKYGSHQQFKSTILGLDRLREEKSRYEARIIEAKEILKKISRDAEESKADPSWLTGGLTLLQLASSERAEIKKDIYGRDEVWWRQKVHTQREELKDAVQNYERSYEEYSKKVEKLGPSRFGGLSLTQYQMTAYGLDLLEKEMAKFQAQITEANGILKKLLREAEESKANPDWLKP